MDEVEFEDRYGNRIRVRRCDNSWMVPAGIIGIVVALIAGIVFALTLGIKGNG